MSRLTEALAELHHALQQYAPRHIPGAGRVGRTLARMAQLEKVAEMARRLVDPAEQDSRAYRLLLLDLALTELDHDTKE